MALFRVDGGLSSKIMASSSRIRGQAVSCRAPAAEVRFNLKT